MNDAQRMYLRPYTLGVSLRDPRPGAESPSQAAARGRADFRLRAEELARDLCGPVAGFEPGPGLSSRAVWFVPPDNGRLVVVAGGHEQMASMDEVLGYALAWQGDRDLLLVLPESYERQTLGRLGPELGLGPPPLCPQALRALLPAAFLRLAALLLTQVRCRLPLALPFLLGGQALGLRLDLLPGPFGRLLFPQPCLGRTFFLAAQLSGLLLHLSRDPALLGLPFPAGALLLPLALELCLLTCLVHLREQRLASGHQVLHRRGAEG
jgi:hypothetical protein